MGAREREMEKKKIEVGDIATIYLITGDGAGIERLEKVTWKNIKDIKKEEFSIDGITTEKHNSEIVKLIKELNGLMYIPDVAHVIEHMRIEMDTWIKFCKKHGVNASKESDSNQIENSKNNNPK